MKDTRRLDTVDLLPQEVGKVLHYRKLYQFLLLRALDGIWYLYHLERSGRGMGI